MATNSLTQLMSTKLYVPSFSYPLIPRPRLTEHLNEGIKRKCTLISAPAGSGKTSLLSSWLSNAQGGNVLMSWLSLDEDDNDPIIFWTYVCAALETHYPGLCGDILNALQAELQPPPASRFLVKMLINALSTISVDFALILDDYHLITNPEIHQDLVFLLNHMPPQMHLFIASRSHPPLLLSLLRSHNQIVEICITDLQFTLSEATAFFKEAMGLNLADTDVVTLVDRAEGWIAGLQLAALAMRGRDPAEITQFILAFAGSHRYILDYLVEEVLTRLPERVQTFLFQTSLLDHMCGSLCDTVTGGTGSQAILEELEQHNVFLIPLDDERCWYRYHHLFAEVLQKRMETGQLTIDSCDTPAELHARASKWYEHHHLQCSAIHHALAGGDFEHAIHLFKRITCVILAQGELFIMLRWFKSLPDEVLRSHPQLCVDYANVLLACGQIEDAQQRLEDAERSQFDHAEQVNPEEKSTLVSEIALLRAFFSLLHGDLAHCEKLCQQALYLLPANHPLRCRVLLILGRAYWLDGEVTSASTTFIAAKEACQTAEDRYHFYSALSYLAQVQALQGHFHEAIGLYHEVPKIAQLSDHACMERGRVLNMAPLSRSPRPLKRVFFLSEGEASMGMAALLYERNALEDAEYHLQYGLSLAQDEGNALALIGGKIMLARTFQAQGKENIARNLMQETTLLSEQYHISGTWLTPSVSASQAWLSLAQGNVETAVQWAQDQVAAKKPQANYVNEVNEIMLARVYLAQGKYEEAQELLARLRIAAESAGRIRHVLEILVLQAKIYHMRRESSQSFAVLTQAVHLAEPEGYIRLFVDEGPLMRTLLSQLREKKLSPTLPTYLDTLIEAFTQRKREHEESLAAGAGKSIEHKHIQPLPNPLTQRELEVLQMIANGASNQEIAQSLVVANCTVKRHVRNIFGKLGVNSRTQAIALARTQEIL
jgi:LuxR family transcriptional regulator, maltose regulon positive regulatory protein